MGPFRLIVTDTSPLFTLALADALDALLRPGISVSIPDAVYIDATRVRGAPGAGRIVDWINEHLHAAGSCRPQSASTSSGGWRRAAPFADSASRPPSKRSSGSSAPTRRPKPCCCSRTPTSSGAVPSSTIG